MARDDSNTYSTAFFISANLIINNICDYHYLPAMMEAENNFVLYQICPPWTIGYFVGNPMSIIGKVVEVNSSLDELRLQVDPERVVVTVLVPVLEIKYLFDETELNYLKQDKAGKQSNSNNGACSTVKLTEAYGEDKNKENEDENSKEAKVTEVVKVITVESFKIGQYIEVRGMCLSKNKIQMAEFTDFGQSYDLRSHNLVLGLGIKYCQSMFY